jgi:hypothetical protein
MGTSLDRREFLQKTTAGMLSAAVVCSAGQAVFAQEPAKKPVRIGVVGTGPRGRWHITNMLTNQQPLEVTAICDIKPDALKAGVDVVKKLSGKEPATYSKNETDYLNLCQRDDVDAVLAAVPSKWLGRMSIDAMKAGKHAAHEVPGCYTIEECWEMVETKEKTGKRCMLLENCCYGEDNMQIMHMIRQDVFGEPYFGEGSYVHDCRHYLFDSSGKITWRGELVRDAYGSSYNPHGLGSPSKWLGINDGDRFESCVCMMSRPKEAHAYCVAKFGADSEPAKVDFKLGDFVTTLIQTALGRQIRVDYSLTSTRPYSRYYVLQGMKGCYDSRAGLYLGPGGPSGDKWGSLAEYKEKYQNPYWKAGAEKAKAAGGHGGIDYFVIQDFVKMVREDKEPWIDVYDAASWASILHFSKLSLDRGGVPVKVDDFTRDKWKDPNWRKAQWV